MAGRPFRLELAKEDMKFSAGHFTIFSATERERLHGHNFSVQVAVDALLQANDMGFDYGIYKKRIRELCDAWDEYFLLPMHSPHLRIEEQDDMVYAHFNGQRIPFLREDVLLLPVQNITVEALSQLFLERLRGDADEIQRLGIQALTVKVFSGPGQCGVAYWRASESR